MTKCLPSVRFAWRAFSNQKQKKIFAFMKVEFVERDFRVDSRKGCPNCSGWMCGFPTMKHIEKESSDFVNQITKGLSIDRSDLEFLSVRDWECRNCDTHFVYISEAKTPHSEA